MNHKIFIQSLCIRYFPIIFLFLAHSLSRFPEEALPEKAP